MCHATHEKVPPTAQSTTMNHFCPEVKDEYGRPAEAVVKFDRVCLISGKDVAGDGRDVGERESEIEWDPEGGDEELVAITVGAVSKSCDSRSSLVSFTAAFSVSASAILYPAIFEVRAV